MTVIAVRSDGAVLIHDSGDRRHGMGHIEHNGTVFPSTPIQSILARPGEWREPD